MAIRDEKAGRQYDVCLSFAGEQRTYVEKVATALQAGGVRVFYDKYEQVELWGKDLYEHLDYVYGKAARYCVLFISSDYAAKLWTNHERKSAQARAFRENREYVLPARFDDTEIPGLRPTVGYVDLARKKPMELAKMIREKLGQPRRENFMPPVPDRLFSRLRVKSEIGRDRVAGRAQTFFQALRRMSDDERRVVMWFFVEGCTAELPANIHISADLLRRLTSLPVAQLEDVFRGLGSLGFVIRVRPSHNSEEDVEQDIASDGPYFVLEYHSLAVGPTGGLATREAEAVVRLVAMDYCSDCAMKALGAMDFSALSSVTVTAEPHH